MVHQNLGRFTDSPKFWQCSVLVLLFRKDIRTRLLAVKNTDLVKSHIDFTITTHHADFRDIISSHLVHGGLATLGRRESLRGPPV